MDEFSRLKYLEKVRQDFVANVSHELRTPVTVIKGFAEALLDGASEDPVTLNRFLGIILRQANLMDSIIHDLLDLSRLDAAAGRTLDRRNTSAAEILENAVELCRARAAERGVIINIKAEPDLAASVHSGLLEQALVNLIDNAAKYGAVEGKDTTVEVSVRRHEDTLVFEVCDHGPGITEEHRQRLFERFYRVDKGRSRELGGTGLGLAIVKHIANIHGGTVGVTSEPQRGSVFTLTLPVSD